MIKKLNDTYICALNMWWKKMIEKNVFTIQKWIEG